MNMFSTTLDVILCSLLLIAILYCWRLDQRLKALRTGKDGMLEAARELQASVADAQSAVSRLRQSAEASGRDLQTRIDEAREMVAAPPASQRQPNDYALRRRTAV
jgi:hypothetical protein